MVKSIKATDLIVLSNFINQTISLNGDLVREDNGRIVKLINCTLNQKEYFDPIISNFLTVLYRFLDKSEESDIVKSINAERNPLMEQLKNAEYDLYDLAEKKKNGIDISDEMVAAIDKERNDLTSKIEQIEKNVIELSVEAEISEDEISAITNLSSLIKDGTTTKDDLYFVAVGVVTILDRITE